MYCFSLSSQFEGNINASIRELLKYNKRNTVEINKILNILAATKPTDLERRQDKTQNGEECREKPVETKIQPANHVLTAQSTEKRIRFSNISKVNKGFQDSEFTDSGTPRRNDIMERSAVNGHRSSTVSMPAFNFLTPARRLSSFRRRFMILRKNPSVCNSSISL